MLSGKAQGSYRKVAHFSCHIESVVVAISVYDGISEEGRNVGDKELLGTEDLGMDCHGMRVCSDNCCEARILEFVDDGFVGKGEV